MSDLGTWGAAEEPASKVSSRENPWQVSNLGQTLKDYISNLGYLWVEGEVAKIQINAAGGRMFAQLKDLRSEFAVDIHAWNLSKVDSTITQGDRVIALIKPDYWPKTGKLSMNVLELRKVGIGDLLEKIENLRAKAIAEKWGEPKLEIPFLPNKIGLITGAKSDAEKDVLENTLRRWPEAQFRVINTLVQGNAAVGEIVNALKTLDADPEVDVIIVARGGGAFLDLVVFSDETLVRTAAEVNTPLISAIGHENDNPVLDTVADLRASTPTDAAKKVVPDVIEERRQLGAALQRSHLAMTSRIASQLGLLQQLRSRPIFVNPHTFITDREEKIKLAIISARQLLTNLMGHEGLRVDHLRQQLRSLSPQATLERGYAVLRDEKGHVLNDATKVKSGTKLKLRLAKGELGATAD